MDKKSYSVPEKIRKLKPKGSMVKNIKGHYYVYEFKSEWNKDTKKKFTKMGKMIGRIFEKEGYVSNTQQAKEIVEDTVIVKNYGAYNMVINLCDEVWMDLKSIFALSDAKRIFTLAVINLVNGYTSLKNCKKFYDHSYLSEKFKDVHISKDTLAEFLECLGCRGEKVNKYYEKQISNSGGKIAIDGHVVQNFSHENELAQFGNKYNKLDSMQFNLLTMFDIENQLPLKTKVYPGSELDKISVSDFIYGINSKDKKYLFIMDAGFYSKHNIETIGTEYNYIIPLSKNLSDYKNALKDLPLNNEFHYKSNPELKLIKFKEIKSNDKRIFVFKDEILSAKEKGKYLSLIEKNIPGYTKEKYDEIKETIGIIVLQTNLDKPADKIYELYKRRWGIETYFDGLKNDLDFNALGLQDYNKIQGYSFILTLTGKMWRIIKNKLRELKKENINFSFPDLILEGEFIKIAKISSDSKWKTSSVAAEKLEVFKKLGFETLTPT